MSSCILKHFKMCIFVLIGSLNSRVIWKSQTRGGSRRCWDPFLKHTKESKELIYRYYIISRIKCHFTDHNNNQLRDCNHHTFWLHFGFVSLSKKRFTCCIAGKFGGGKVWQIDLFLTFGERKFGELIVISANRSLIVSTNLDGFSLVNCRRFAKFTKLSSRQTFSQYGM